MPTETFIPVTLSRAPRRAIGWRPINDDVRAHAGTTVYISASMVQEDGTINPSAVTSDGEAAIYGNEDGTFLGYVHVDSLSLTPPSPRLIETPHSTLIRTAILAHGETNGWTPEHDAALSFLGLPGRYPFPTDPLTTVRLTDGSIAVRSRDDAEYSTPWRIHPSEGGRRASIVATDDEIAKDFDTLLHPTTERTHND